jgi:hypothetical protein
MVMKVLVTHHAEVRMQQRAVTFNMLERLLEFGHTRFNGRGTAIVSFPKKSVKKLKAKLKHHEYVSLEKHLNLYAVVSLDDELLTVGYRTRHMRLH